MTRGQLFSRGAKGGAVLLAVENAPPEKRAWYGMFPQLGAPIGFLFSGSIFLMLSAWLTDELDQKVDVQKMEQVLINLFMNAIQAMPNGGNLILRTRATACDLDAAADVLNKFQPGDRLVSIEVEDTGIGIPEEKAQRVFEPFFTTKPNGIGTGLGLPVSKQIVDMHGGLIKLCAGARGGARATVILKAVEHEKETNLVG